MNKKPIQPVSTPPNGNTRDLARYFKLIWRLLRDQRVHPLLKILPIGAMIYLAWPLDLAPGMTLPVIGALDDMAILWLGLNLFVELSPADVVQEHRQQLGLSTTNDPDGDIIDARSEDVD